MRFLSRGEAVNASNPVLEVWTQQLGVLSDPDTLEFQIWNKTGASPAQVFPVSGREAVDLVAHKLGTGHFFAAYAVDGSATKGLYEVRWFSTRDGEETEFAQDFNVTETKLAKPFPRVYALITDARAEEITEAQANDARVLRSLAMASAQIERFTNQVFGYHGKTVQADGRGSADLLLREPIIGLSELKVQTHAFGAETVISETDLDDIGIYNRHLSGLTDPDDRDNPKLSFYRLHDHFGQAYRETRPLFPNHVFPFGQQNVKAIGAFGYTDPDGSPMGDVPALIRLACVLLAARIVDPALGAASSSSSTGPAGPIVREKTRDQEVEYAKPSSSQGLGGAGPGPYTGDAEIDNILLMYSKGTTLGAA